MPTSIGLPVSDFDERLQAKEKALARKSFLQDGTMVGDITCQRIDWLVQHYLQKIADGTGGWDKLYRDPVDAIGKEHTHKVKRTAAGVRQHGETARVIRIVIGKELA